MPEARELPVRKRGRATRRRELRDGEYFTDLAYRKWGKSRFTQDSPILADVIVHYGLLGDKSRPLELLLTPDWSKNPGQVADEVRDWLDPEAAPSEESDWDVDHEPMDEHRIAYNQSVVAARLTFEELVCHVLPLSGWWQNRLIALRGRTPVEICNDPKLCDIARRQLLEGLKLEIAGHHEEVGSEPDLDEDDGNGQGGPFSERWETRHWMIRQDLAWAARLFYIVKHSNVRTGRAAWHEPDDDPEAIADYFFELVMRITDRQAEYEARQDDKRKAPPRGSWVYSINRNRRIRSAIYDSVKATKADAARQTFGVTGEGICWAIIDTGIDARHAAFRKLDGDGVPYDEPFGDGASDDRTRIRATYDFSDIRRKLHKRQRRSLKAGRLLNWETLEKELKLRVPHTKHGYRTPLQSHGTHVAGILAADWRPDPSAVDPLGPPPTERVASHPLTGLCPEIELYDLRVFRQGGGDEFAVMSALQFVRSLNQRHDKLEVHGVNLSLAMRHEVSNYACGRSPVCDECSRLVGNGVVVVAAAGNDGRSIYTTTQNRKQEGYRTVSIADPGNTEAVITVGATHRRDPHTYGVSYFSSRGPTGDGRIKPDLVAPGEKILSTVPGDGQAREDGTSQAAPHVSGAAALLMSRHRELIGDPARVKQVLMATATDLGRERYFQGAGLVDIMRAIQSL